MTEEQMRDLVKECGLDWHKGYQPLFEGDTTNRFAVLIGEAQSRAQPSQPQYPGRIELVMPCGDPRQVRIVTTDRKPDGTLQLCIEVAAQPSQPQPDAIAKSKTILELVDKFVELPTNATRSALRKALLDSYTAQPSQSQDALRKEYERGLEDAAQWWENNHIQWDDDVAKCIRTLKGKP